MLEPDQWESALASVTGTIYRGTERVGTKAILDLLQFRGSREDRAKAGKRIVSTMRVLGWNGPRAMRLGVRESGSGYWRLPFRPPGDGRQAIEDTSDVLSDDLPAALEHVTSLGLRKLARVLRAPTDLSDGALTRSQVTAALGAVNAQLRADEQRLRAKVSGDVLERLLKAIESERKRLGRSEPELAEALAPTASDGERGESGGACEVFKKEGKESKGE